MYIELTHQNIITAGALLTAVIAISTHFPKGVRWFDKQEKPDRHRPVAFGSGRSQRICRRRNSGFVR
jgi:hypothetical protein